MFRIRIVRQRLKPEFAVCDILRHVGRHLMRTPPRVRVLTLIHNVKEPCLDAEDRAIGDVCQYIGDV